MPLVTSDFVARINLFGVVLSQETVNRFFYASDAVLPTLTELADEFEAVVIPALTLVMSNASGFSRMELQMVRGNNTFISRDLNEVGANSGDCLPPYAAFDFTLLRGGGGERNGYKRIAGIPESEQSNGVATVGTIPALNLAADAMADILSPGTDDWNPVIQRTRVNRIPQIPPVYYSVSSVVYSKIGTQNSRKFGHGR